VSAQRLRVAPTKNNLLALKHQVTALEEGHDLLERKRELLTRLVYQRIGAYRTLRADAQQALAKAWHWLAMTHMRMGSQALAQSALGATPSIAVSILPRRALGVPYPAVKAERLPLKPSSLLCSDASLDEARHQLTEAALALAKLSESRVALCRLLREQRKARKRVNALRYNIIPRYRETIRYIESALEEEERSMLFQIKMLHQQHG
jgi:V/A-type H+-transporting ATPase subunit D